MKDLLKAYLQSKDSIKVKLDVDWFDFFFWLVVALLYLKHFGVIK